MLVVLMVIKVMMWVMLTRHCNLTVVVYIRRWVIIVCIDGCWQPAVGKTMIVICEDTHCWQINSNAVVRIVVIVAIYLVRGEIGEWSESWLDGLIVEINVGDAAMVVTVSSGGGGNICIYIVLFEVIGHGVSGRKSMRRFHGYVVEVVVRHCTA